MNEQILRNSIQDLKSNFKAALKKAAPLLPQAFKSRKSVLRATGQLNSGLSAQCSQEHETRLEELDRLNKVEILPDIQYTSLKSDDKLDELEKERFRFCELNQEVNALIDRCEAMLKEDDKSRENITANHHRQGPEWSR